MKVMRERPSMTSRYNIIECEQGSPEWYAARRGIPTSSRFGDMMAIGEGKTRLRYMRELAAEVITNETTETFSNEKMERGRKFQARLEAMYLYDNDDIQVEHVGFIRSTLMATGCSPDGLIGDRGMVEFKSTEPHLLVEILQTGKVPNHRAQVQGQLWITGREWCDLVIGWPKMPLSVTRIHRDESYMAGLRLELQRFNTELDLLVSQLKAKL
jgi:hypothetical protein